MLLTACTAIPTSPNVVQIKPPEQILQCKSAPNKPIADATQKVIASWVTNLYFSWKDCYNKLSNVKAFVNDAE